GPALRRAERLPKGPRPAALPPGSWRTHRPSQAENRSSGSQPTHRARGNNSRTIAASTRTSTPSLIQARFASDGSCTEKCPDCLRSAPCRAAHTDVHGPSCRNGCGKHRLCVTLYAFGSGGPGGDLPDVVACGARAVDAARAVVAARGARAARAPTRRVTPVYLLPLPSVVRSDSFRDANAHIRIAD